MAKIFKTLKKDLDKLKTVVKNDKPVKIPNNLYSGKIFRIMRPLNVIYCLAPYEPYETLNRKINLPVFSDIEIGKTVPNGEMLTYSFVGITHLGYPAVILGVDLDNSISAGYLKEISKIEKCIEFRSSRLQEIE